LFGRGVFAVAIFVNPIAEEADPLGVLFDSASGGDQRIVPAVDLAFGFEQIAAQLPGGRVAS